MLKYPVNMILLILLAILSVILALKGIIGWVLTILIVHIVVGVIIYGCSVLSSGFFMPVICRGSSKQKTVSLTFDDGPWDEQTSAVLDILKEENVAAVFFCIGKNIRGRERVVKRMVKEGHIVANHSFSHGFMFDMKSSRDMLSDLQQADETIFAAAGLRPKLFRPPYGVINPALTKAIKRGGYQPVGWSIRSFDTRATSSEALTQRVIRKLHPGAVILLHDRCELTAAALRQIIHEIRREGYSIERADRLLQLTPYA